MGRRRVLVHRFATVVCVLLAIPAVLWWKTSILFVILLSLATQAYTSLGSAEAADDRAVTGQLDEIKTQLDALAAELHTLSKHDENRGAP